MDLFEKEQHIYDNAYLHAIDVRNGAPLNLEEFETITKEYGKLLKHVRRITKLADKTTIDLFESNIDLIDKAHRDTLTGVFNRRYLEEKIKFFIKDLSRSNSLMSILMIDIDFFKKYNDTYGHNKGDICLKSIAEIFTECISREDDFVARYGGEEFVIALPHTDEKGALLTAQKVLDKLASYQIPHEKNEGLGYVTVSIGLSTINVKHTHNLTDYIKCADEALYISKQNGRNRFTYLQFKGE
ncbi:MAG: GGDEF domain-containing protein [Treponema sp.]|nr:GGDEF domain-containing protein [Treponema sp.]MCL2250788.1 GGDEF domain-containing protein [Treponema sp.]